MMPDEDLIGTPEIQERLLYGKLCEGLPTVKYGDGKLNIPKLSGLLGVSRQAVYYWISQDRIPIKRALQLTQIEGSDLLFEDLIEFVDLN